MRMCAATVVTVVALLLLALAPSALAGPLNLPVPISTTQDLSTQLGYWPDYPRNVVTFDAMNHPVIRSRTASQDDTSFVAILTDTGWQTSSLTEALRTAFPDFAGYMGAGGYASDRVVFDSSGRAYTVLTIRLEEGDFRNVMLYSLDGCASWRVVELPMGEEQPRYGNANRGNVACETFTGHNTMDGPPFIAVWREVSDWPGAYASRSELYVTQPYLDGETVVVPKPVLVTDRFLGMMQSAGGTSFAATVGGRTYFTWAQVRDKPTKGTPIYVGVYENGVIVQRRRVCYAHPVNDSHCTPCLSVDSTGVLHLISGAHGRPFRYSHTLRPGDISEWTRDVPVLDSGYWTNDTDPDGVGRQTYASLVCGADDRLHLIFRQTRCEPGGVFSGRAYHVLCYQTRPPSGAWSKPLMLAYCSDGPGYTNFYQKLTLDRNGRLYLSFSVFRRSYAPKLYRSLRRFRYRMVWWSDDGLTWHLATSEDFAGRVSGN